MMLINNKSTCPFEEAHSYMDYVRVAWEVALFIIGAPVNTFIFWRLIRRSLVMKNRSRILLLNINLNISDLIVVYVYILSDVIWFATWWWHGGRALCKIVKFLRILGFYISSNAIICISIDRVWRVTATARSERCRARRVQIILVVGWISGILCSLPQLYVWTTYAPCKPYHDKVQCSSVFAMLALEAVQDSTILLSSNSTDSHEIMTLLRQYKLIYSVFHLLVVFWIPFILVVGSYGFILRTVVINYNRRASALQATDGARYLPQSTSTSSESWHKRGYSCWRGRLYQCNEGYMMQLDGSVRVPLQEMHRVCSCGNHRWGSCPSTRKQSQALSQQQYRSLPTTPNLNNTAATTMRVRRAKSKTFVVSLLIVTTYLICWLPYNLLSLWKAIFYNYASGYTTTAQVAIRMEILDSLVTLNSVINPFLYGWYAARKDKDQSRMSSLLSCSLFSSLNCKGA